MLFRIHKNIHMPINIFNRFEEEKEEEKERKNNYYRTKYTGCLC